MSDLEEAERVVTAALSVEERVPKCILITLLEQHFGISRRVAKNLLMRLVAKGIYVDLYYDLMLPQDLKKATPPPTEKKEEKENRIPIHSTRYLSTILYPILLFALQGNGFLHTIQGFIPHFKVI